MDRYPKYAPSPNNLFTDEASAKQAVIASYKPWTWLEGNMYYKELIILMDAFTDDSDIRLNGSDRIQVHNWEIQANHPIFFQWWQFPFQSVNAANYAIQ